MADENPLSDLKYEVEYQPGPDEAETVRGQLMAKYASALTNGDAHTADIEAERWKYKLPLYCFRLEPKPDWFFLAHELRLVNLSFDDVAKPDRKGVAVLAKDAAAILQSIRTLKNRIFDFLEADELYTVLEDENLNYTDDLIAALYSDETVFEKLLIALEAKNQSPKWRQALMRQQRIALAYRLTAVYESCFSDTAKPGGGSAMKEIFEENNWTKFYQCVASEFFKENATPDRQAVLWEARRLSDKAPYPLS